MKIQAKAPRSAEITVVEHDLPRVGISVPSRFAHWVLGILGASLLLVPMGSSASQEATDLELVKQQYTSWVQTRTAISQERKNWGIDHELLSEQIQISKSQIEAEIENKLQSEEKLKESDQAYAEFLLQEEAQKAALAGLEDRIQALEKRTRQLLERAPEPIAVRLTPISQSLPAEGAEKLPSLGQRYVTVLALLGELDKANTSLVTASEKVPLSDGSIFEVTTFYLGLGQGYYVSRDGKFAGRGTGTPGGWVWTPDDAHAVEIKRAIDIFENTKPANFVRLPIDIQ